MKTSKPFFSFLFKKLVFRRNSLFFKIISAYLLPFSLIYLSAVFFKKLFQRPADTGFSVISVGNIISGGTGKTPLVMEIAKILQDSGELVAIASSGISGNKKRLKAGLQDEGVMIKKNFPKIKTVHKSRQGLKELKKSPAEKLPKVILDDGFHCRYIKRDVNILVLSISNPFDNNLLIPSGLLREPKRFLKDADVFILAGASGSSKKQSRMLENYLQKFNKPVFFMDYEIQSIKSADREYFYNSVAGKKIIAVAGIGSPMSFFSLLSGLSAAKTYAAVYPDHFIYKKYDIDELSRFFYNEKADCIITTEKDFVKLQPLFPQSFPLFFLKIRPAIKNRRGDITFDNFLKKMLD